MASLKAPKRDGLPKGPKTPHFSKGMASLKAPKRDGLPKGPEKGWPP